MAEHVLEESSSESTLIPEDTILRAELIEAPREITKTNKDKTETYLRYDWKFRVNDPTSDYDGKVVYGETTRTFTRNENCKLYMWSAALLGLDLTTGFKLDTDQLKGLECRIVIGNRHYTKDGEPRVYTFVSDVMPVRGLVNEPF